MTIFNNVKKFTINEEVKTLIKLKYGEQKLTIEYIEKLPSIVVFTAYKSLCNGNPFTTPSAEGLLRFYNEEKALKAISEALEEYHSLL
jgi:hypothetical protein